MCFLLWDNFKKIAEWPYSYVIWDKHLKRGGWISLFLLVQDLASSIQRGSLDWERALRCIKHALRTTPSPDWWKRVLLVAPCYRHQTQGSNPGAVFTYEMIGEATIERIVELLKLTNSGNFLFLRLFLLGFSFSSLFKIKCRFNFMLKLFYWLSLS